MRASFSASISIGPLSLFWSVFVIMLWHFFKPSLHVSKKSQLILVSNQSSDYHIVIQFILMITRLFLPCLATSGCLSEVGRIFFFFPTSCWREERKSRADVQPFYIVWQLGLSRPFICQVPAEKSGRLDSLHSPVQHIYISAPIKTSRYATATYFLPSPASAL